MNRYGTTVAPIRTTTPIPTTTPTIRCRRCSGDGRELVDMLVRNRDGQPVYRLTPRDCARCQGRGYLLYQPHRHQGVARVRPSPQPAASSRTAA